MNPFNSPTEVYIVNYPWGKYLGCDTDQGCDVCVSSWTRLAPNTMPAMAKAGANYMNSQLIKMEAIVNGYAEGIALDVNGYVSEGSGENVFIVRNGTLQTAPLGNSVLPGITRDSVLQIAPRPRHSGRRDRSFRARCSTSPTKSSSVARRPRSLRSARSTKSASAKASAGPITKAIQKEFYAIVQGREGRSTPLAHARPGPQ